MPSPSARHGGHRHQVPQELACLEIGLLDLPEQLASSLFDHGRFGGSAQLTLGWTVATNCAG